MLPARLIHISFPWPGITLYPDRLVKPDPPRLRLKGEIGERPIEFSWTVTGERRQWPRFEWRVIFGVAEHASTVLIIGVDEVVPLETAALRSDHR